MDVYPLSTSVDKKPSTQHSQHGLLTIGYVAIPIGAKGQAVEYGEWLGRWSRISLSSQFLRQHQATTHAVGQRLFVCMIPRWASCSSAMTLSGGGTMILLPHSQQPSCNSVHLSFSNKGLAPSVPDPHGQANRAVQSI